MRHHSASHASAPVAATTTLSIDINYGHFFRVRFLFVGSEQKKVKRPQRNETKEEE